MLMLCRVLYLTYGKTVWRPGYNIPRTTLEAYSASSWLVGLAALLINNPMINYTKLKQKRHYQEQCHDLQCCTWVWASSATTSLYATSCLLQLGLCIQSGIDFWLALCWNEWDNKTGPRYAISATVNSMPVTSSLHENTIEVLGEGIMCAQNMAKPFGARTPLGELTRSPDP